MTAENPRLFRLDGRMWALHALHAGHDRVSLFTRVAQSHADDGASVFRFDSSEHSHQSYHSTLLDSAYTAASSPLETHVESSSLLLLRFTLNNVIATASFFFIHSFLFAPVSSILSQIALSAIFLHLISCQLLPFDSAQVSTFHPVPLRLHHTPSPHPSSPASVATCATQLHTHLNQLQRFVRFTPDLYAATISTSHNSNPRPPARPISQQLDPQFLVSSSRRRSPSRSPRGRVETPQPPCAARSKPGPQGRANPWDFSLRRRSCAAVQALPPPRLHKPRFRASRTPLRYEHSTRGRWSVRWRLPRPMHRSPFQSPHPRRPASRPPPHTGRTHRPARTRALRPSGARAAESGPPILPLRASPPLLRLRRCRLWLRQLSPRSRARSILRPPSPH